MGIKTIAYKTAAVFLLLGLTVSSTYATSPISPPLEPMRLEARYIVAWSGITLGRILIEADEDTQRYRMSIDTKTKGLGALVSNAKQVVTVKGSKIGEDVYAASEYFSRPHNREDANTILLKHDNEGKIVERVRPRDDDPAWRPPVPFSEVGNARDPITTAFMLRRMLYQAVNEDRSQLSLRTYDGMRLAKMQLTRGRDARVEIMDEYIPCVDVRVQRLPINGYTPKEWKKFYKGDPEIHLYFSKDAKFLPVRATAKVAFGELSMTMIENKRQ